MQRKFNDTGLCVPNRHYMVDTSEKIDQIVELVEKGEYFTINRPRQFGKTTTLSLLAKQLNARDDYVALKISFEEIDADSYQSQENFISLFLQMLQREFDFLAYSDLSQLLGEHSERVKSLSSLSQLISKLVRIIHAQQSLVLLIDEVDKSSNNQLFLDFLGMLRNKYLQRNEGRDETFQSVILAGVHDIKTLKAKIRPNDDKKFNSPWNIAVDFEVDLSFSPEEISTMLQDYSREIGIQADIPGIAEKLYYYSSGYPYLVSKLCKFIDEKIVPRRARRDWTIDDVETAFTTIVDGGYTTTLFDSLAQNLENNPDLYELVFQIVINGATFDFVITNPVINLGHLYGILSRTEQGQCRIHNRIFEQRIYAHMMSRVLQTKYRRVNGFGGPEFYIDGGDLDVAMILKRFQAFMKEHYSSKDKSFLEREGRLLFLSYLRPIVNGKGFAFKEPNVAEERRMDLVLTYGRQRYVIELKIWRGAKYHQEGLQQLSDYLDIYSLKQGFLLIYDFNNNKEYKQEEIVFADKQIYTVWV